MDYRSNILKMYLFSFLTSMHFFGAVLVPFFLDWGHITFAQVMLLQSWFMLWMFILEVPTGAVADYLGRKWSVLLACAANIIGILVYISAPNFYTFLAGEFFWAMSAALLSGAKEAFVYDSLKKINKTNQSKKVFGRLESFHLAGIMVASPIGSVLAAKFGLTAPMLFTVIPVILALFVALTLKEPLTTKKVESMRYINILKTGVLHVYKHKILKIIALDLISLSAIAYFMIWLFQPMLKQAGVGIAYYGVVQTIFVLSQITIMNAYPYLEKILGSKTRVVFLSAFLTGLMYIIGGLTTFIPAVIAAIVIGGGFGLSRKPILYSYMNKYIPSEHRATALSSIAMMEKFTIAMANPIMGLAAEWSLNYTLIALGALAIAFAFISRVEEKHLID